MSISDHIDQDMKEEIEKLRVDCEYNSTLYAKWANIYTFSNSLSTFCVVIGGLFIAAIVQMTEPEISKPVITAISIGISILKSLQQVFKWPDKGLEYKKTSMKYKNIKRSIIKFISHTRINGIEPHIFMEKLTEYYKMVDDIEMSTFKYNITSEVHATNIKNISPILGKNILKNASTPMSRTPKTPLFPALNNTFPSPVKTNPIISNENKNKLTIDIGLLNDNNFVAQPKDMVRVSPTLK